MNIVVNGINTILLAINSNFKLNDRYNHLRSLKTKFTALNHESHPGGGKCDWFQEKGIL
jgi:hypothetical protein